MTELAADGIPVAVTCRVLKLSRQPYYRWLAAPITPGEVVEAYRANALFDAQRDDPEFGHRLLADEARDAGEAMSDRTAWRIASDNGWFSAFGKPKRGKHRKPGPLVHDDLCAVVDEHGRTPHLFAADTANELWLTDITEHKPAEGQALPLRYQEHLLRPDRRVLHRLEDEVSTGSGARSPVTTWSETWAESGRAEIARRGRCSYSSRCCRRTSLTAARGPSAHTSTPPRS